MPIYYLHQLTRDSKHDLIRPPLLLHLVGTHLHVATHTPDCLVMKKRPTQFDVARKAGVSRSTVSFVLNDKTGGNVPISDETRQRVLTAIEMPPVAEPYIRR